MNLTQPNNLKSILNFLRTNKKDFSTDIKQIKSFLTHWNKSPVIGHNIRIIGMRRSGNHAIINWLVGELSTEKTIF